MQLGCISVCILGTEKQNKHVNLSIKLQGRPPLDSSYELETLEAKQHSMEVLLTEDKMHRWTLKISYSTVIFIYVDKKKIAFG